MKTIAAIVPYALGRAPGQRVRIESWAPHLEELGWHVDFLPFESEELKAIVYEPGRHVEKAWHMIQCYARQFARLLGGSDADVVFISREASLIGPAILERLAARLGPPLVYDIDDPIFLPYRSPANDRFSLLKFSRKTNTLLRLADRVVCVNERIAAYATRFNSRVSIVPNCVDADIYQPQQPPTESPVRLVWIGSHSTLCNLRAIERPLVRLQERYDASLRLIGPGSIKSLPVRAEVRPWSAETEVAELQQCHIGIVPLLPHPWNAWKFFFKTIQYMAVGLPIVAASEGSNAEIIEDGANGFLVRSEDEWYERLALLCGDADLRRRMGRAARATIVERYSLQMQMPRVAATFEAARTNTERHR